MKRKKPPKSAKPTPCPLETAAQAIETMGQFPKWQQERILGAIVIVLDLDLTIGIRTAP